MSRILVLMTTPEVDASTTESEPWIPSMDTFATRLALVRHRMGWNVKEAARECGVPGASWRFWEMNGGVPRSLITIAMTIAAKTGCDYLWLVHGPDRGGTIRSNNYGPEPHVVTTVGQGRRSTIGPYVGHAVRQTRPLASALRRSAVPVPA